MRLFAKKRGDVIYSGPPPAAQEKKGRKLYSNRFISASSRIPWLIKLYKAISFYALSCATYTFWFIIVRVPGARNKHIRIDFQVAHFAFVRLGRWEGGE